MGGKSGKSRRPQTPGPGQYNPKNDTVRENAPF